MTSTVAGIHLGIDTHANRPAANTAPDGSMYSCSTHGLIYKSNYAGNSWATWATLGGAAVDDATIATTDITTNNASTSKHGWLKKLDNDATHFMDGQGNWAVPAAGSAGALVLLESHTAATSATLDFATRNAAGQSGATIQSDYDEYQIEIVGLRPATNSVSLWMRVSTDGGSTYDTTAIYSYADYRFISSGSAPGGAVTQAQFQVTNGTDTVANTATAGVNGSLKLFNPLSTVVYKYLRGSLEYVSTNLEGTIWVGGYASTTAINAFRFLFSSGNIALGTIRVYGVAK